MTLNFLKNFLIPLVGLIGAHWPFLLLAQEMKFSSNWGTSVFLDWYCLWICQLGSCPPLWSKVLTVLPWRGFGSQPLLGQNKTDEPYPYVRYSVTSLSEAMINVLMMRSYNNLQYWVWALVPMRNPVTSAYGAVLVFSEDHPHTKALEATLSPRRISISDFHWWGPHGCHSKLIFNQ